MPTLVFYSASVDCQVVRLDHFAGDLDALQQLGRAVERMAATQGPDRSPPLSWHELLRLHLHGTGRLRATSCEAHFSTPEQVRKGKQKKRKKGKKGSFLARISACGLVQGAKELLCG